MKTRSYPNARYLPFGDCGLLVEFGDSINPEISRRVTTLADAIARASIRGAKEFVPTYRSLLIQYDPEEISCERMAFQVKDIESTLENAKTESEERRFSIPVAYGGEFGPDLSYIARSHCLTENQVIQMHSAVEYRVYMIGFVAGFPYMGEVADEIATPRLTTPRLKVPAGSVGIAEKQTGVYPRQAPGGWQIIGRTPLTLFAPETQPPTSLRAGDTVVFKPIQEDEFKVLGKRKASLSAIGARCE